MKRFIWLLLFAVGAALAQVQPVDLPAKAGKCCCCADQAGACGMPDCSPAPAAPSSGLSLPVVAVERTETRKPSRSAKRELFQVGFDFRPSTGFGRGVSPSETPVAAVPLFKVHCSFLI